MTKALEGFKIQDGDKIRISPSCLIASRLSILTAMWCISGKHAFREGMRITDLIRSYTDLLPEPAARHAEVIRLAPPDFAPQVIAFNLADALADRAEKAKRNEPGEPPTNNAQNMTLQPFDTVRIFGRYDFEDPR